MANAILQNRATMLRDIAILLTNTMKFKTDTRF